MSDIVERLQQDRDPLSHEAAAEITRLRAFLDTPETTDWMKGVEFEAAHQQKRWGSDHDVGKAPEDWLWLLGYLAGKALHAAKSGDTEKAKHHTISTGAALLNWHRQLSGAGSIRPGIEPPSEEEIGL